MLLQWFYEVVLNVGAQLGATEILVAGNDPDLNRCADNFLKLCELAKQFGMRPHLEFMPFTDAKNLDCALEILAPSIASGFSNASILLDAFHYSRAGTKVEDLSAIPPERMHYIQLCDVAGPIPASMEEIIDEARNRRCFPGEGDIDLKSFLTALPVDIPLSLEIPTQGLYKQGISALDRAKMALQATRKYLALM